MKNKGFSIIEVMIVIAILAIISGISIPVIKNILYKYKSDTLTLYSYLLKAKSTAIKENNIIYVGINKSGIIDIYNKNYKLLSFSLEYNKNINSNLTGGILGKKELPDTPQDIKDKCTGLLVNCEDYKNWVSLYSGKEYDYIFNFNPLGMINKNFILINISGDKNNITITNYGSIKISYN